MIYYIVTHCNLTIHCVLWTLKSTHTVVVFVKNICERWGLSQLSEGDRQSTPWTGCHGLTPTQTTIKVLLIFGIFVIFIVCVLQIPAENKRKKYFTVGKPVYFPTNDATFEGKCICRVSSSVWVAPMKNLPSFLSQCHTAFSATCSCSELLVPQLLPNPQMYFSYKYGTI